MTIAAEHHRFIMTDGSSSGDANRCPNSWFGAHKMEARYDLGPADLSQFATFQARNVSYMDALRTKTYVRDICVRCGKTIERIK